MDRNLRIQVLFAGLDRLSAPIRQLSQGSKGLSKALAQSQREALGLKRAEAQIAQYRGAEQRLQSTSAELEKARAKTAELSRQLGATEAPTRRMQAALERARRAEARTTETHEAQGNKLQELGRKLDSAGIDVSQLDRHEEQLAEQLRTTNRQIDQQRERLERLQRIRAQGEALRRTGGNMASAGATATVGVTLPAVALGVASGGAFLGFEDSMANVSTLVDENVESMEVMKRQLLALSRRAPVQIEQLSAALYDIRSAGIPAAQAMSVLERSAKLGVAGLGTTAEAADIATSAINAFGLRGAEADRIYDTVFKTVKTGKTTISQLAQGFGAVAGTVANAGVKVDEYLASVAALTTTGLPAAQAHTQIRAAIAGLTRSTEQSRKVFRDLGAKDFKDLIDKSGGLVPALNRIKGQLHGNDAAMLQLFGSTEALNAVIALTGNQADAYTSALADMRQGQDALDPAFAKKMAQDTAKLAINTNRLRVAGIAIGAIVVPVFASLAERVAGLAEWFGQLDPATQSTIVTIVAIGAALGPVLTIVGNFTGAIGFLLPLLTRLGPLLMLLARGALLFAAMLARAGLMLLANPLVLAIVAIIAVVAALGYAIYANWDRIRAAFDAGLKWLSALGSKFAEMGANLLRGLVNGMLAGLGWVKDQIVGVGNKVVGWFKGVLGIHSPSRVFAGLGGHIMQGLANGLDNGAAAPIARIRSAGLQLRTALAASTLAVAPVTVGSPFAGAAAASTPSASGAALTIGALHVHAAPGMNERELAELVAEKIRDALERAERNAKSRRASSYQDPDE